MSIAWRSTLTLGPARWRCVAGLALAMIASAGVAGAAPPVATPTPAPRGVAPAAELVFGLDFDQVPAQFRSSLEEMRASTLETVSQVALTRLIALAPIEPRRIKVRGDQLVIDVAGWTPEHVERARGVLTHVGALRLHAIGDGAPLLAVVRMPVAGVRSLEAAGIAVRSAPAGGDALRHTEDYLEACERDERVPTAWARAHGCTAAETGGMVTCHLTGRQILVRYLFDDLELGLALSRARPGFPRLPKELSLLIGPSDPEPARNTACWRSYVIVQKELIANIDIDHTTTVRASAKARLETDLALSPMGVYQLAKRSAGTRFAIVLDGQLVGTPPIADVQHGSHLWLRLADRDAPERTEAVLAAAVSAGPMPMPLREQPSAPVKP